MLDAFLELPENWDSYGAEKIKPRAVEVAKMLVPLLDGYSVVPTPEDGVQFELHANDGDIEIEISV